MVGRLSSSLRCSFSSFQPAKTDKDSEDETLKQPFVTAHLEPGEWDVNRTDPYFRPKPPKTSKLISAEDFANRPPVAFENEFSTLNDSMISLGWLDSKTCRQMYQSYVDMMVLAQEQHGKTSHEYVVRVIAQKFNVTTWRAAGIIQLQHAEEQMRQHNPELLCDEQAKHAEQSILQNIRDAYRAERSDPPRPNGGFMEDPVGIHGRGDPDETSRNWTKANDIYDLQQKLEEATVRDAKMARLLIDGHVYKEDAEDSKQDVPIDATCRKLLKKSREIPGPQETTIDYPQTNAKGGKRTRWKYVAKVVNTRNLRNKKHATGNKRIVTSYTNNNISNTLVEHDGELRVATVEEAKQVAWKPTREGNEYIYEGVKNDWLQKTKQGKSSVWGRGPITRASDSTGSSQKTQKKENEEVNVTEEEEPDESSSSSSDEDEDGGETEGEDKDEVDGSSDDDDDDDDDKKGK